MKKISPLKKKMYKTHSQYGQVNFFLWKRCLFELEKGQHTFIENALESDFRYSKATLRGH